MHFIVIALIIGFAFGTLGIIGIIQRASDERQEEMSAMLNDFIDRNEKAWREEQMAAYLESA